MHMAVTLVAIFLLIADGTDSILVLSQTRFTCYSKVNTQALCVGCFRWNSSPNEKWGMTEVYHCREQKLVLSTNPTSRKSPRRAVGRHEAMKSDITDWIIENLETDDSKITWSSSTIAGENDILPHDGLSIGKFRIQAAGCEVDANEQTRDERNKLAAMDKSSSEVLLPIQLLAGRNGWGTGVHPTTRLCLEFLCIDGVVREGDKVLDYGCGSGILSIAALRLGASRCVGVDIEAEALVTAERNVEWNGFYNGRFEPLHTREVLPYEIVPGADLCVANILIGQLVRPSMVAAIGTNVAPGALICFSGIRPDEVSSLKNAYHHIMDEWFDDSTATNDNNNNQKNDNNDKKPSNPCHQYSAVLAASNCPGSIESYGYDCGTWCRVVGRRKRSVNSKDDILTMSDSAVS